MKVRCFTNLDLYQEEWPTDLPCLPQVGNEIDSLTKHINGSYPLRLEVVAIRFVQNHNGEYIPEIELHTRKFKTIRAFYEWYAPAVNRSIVCFI